MVPDAPRIVVNDPILESSHFDTQPLTSSPVLARFANLYIAVECLTSQGEAQRGGVISPRAMGDEEETPVPPPGVESIFLTGTWSLHSNPGCC